MKNLIAILISLLITGFSYGQNCNCEKNFEWVKKTFEENDAGFQYVIEFKGDLLYENHNKLFLKRVKSISEIEECTKVLYEWLTFFRSGHIAINRLNSINNEIRQSTPSKINEIRDTVNIDIFEFDKYLNSNKASDFEGIWEIQPYKIGIRKFENSFVGFIIETSAENWKVGEIKSKFSDKKGVFYLRDKSLEEFTSIKLIGKNYLQLGRFTLKRVSPKYITEKSVETYFKLINAEKPFIEELNKATLLLRIPSFEGSQKRDIDSVLLVNKSKILKTENLIIDLRNNGGGSDWSYKELIPFIYTNPIRIVGVEMLSTKLNNQRMLELINNPEFGLDEDTKKWAKTSYDTLEKHLGTFVNLDSTKVDILKLDTIYTYPKNVGIIINKGDGSTTEQFLLAAKQSRKVKLFGTTTFGVLDISNMHFVKSPCGEFDLGYSLSKSHRIPEMTIDGKGIQPDYFIDDEIQEYEWIEYVSKILNQQY
ncbi:MAG: peptidase S41 [Bacteroidales bacterium]|nr:peptidase S41 [Bacteroidales bacterium]